MKLTIGENYGKAQITLVQRGAGCLIAICEDVPYIMLPQPFYRTRLYWHVKYLRKKLRAMAALQRPVKINVKVIE